MTANDRVIITGVGGGSLNRLEINDFVKNDKFFSLYIQALRRCYLSCPRPGSESFQNSCIRAPHKLNRSLSSKLEEFTAFPTFLGTAQLVTLTVHGVAIAPMVPSFSRLGTGRISCFMKWSCNDSAINLGLTIPCFLSKSFSNMHRKLPRNILSTRMSGNRPL